MNTTYGLHVIGRGLAGWHAAGVNLSVSGYSGTDVPPSALTEAVEGCLVYDASAVVDQSAYVAHVVCGPIPDCGLPRGSVDRFVNWPRKVEPLALGESASSCDRVSLDIHAAELWGMPGVRVGVVHKGKVLWACQGVAS